VIECSVEDNCKLNGKKSFKAKMSRILNSRHNFPVLTILRGCRSDPVSRGSILGGQKVMGIRR
jgi:hypothetical protein